MVWWKTSINPWVWKLKVSGSILGDALTGGTSAPTSPARSPTSQASPSPWPTTVVPSSATLLAFPLRDWEHHRLTHHQALVFPRPCSALRRVGSIEDPKPPGEKKSCGFILGSSHSCRKARWHYCFRNYNNNPRKHGMLCPVKVNSRNKAAVQDLSDRMGLTFRIGFASKYIPHPSERIPSCESLFCPAGFENPDFQPSCIRLRCGIAENQQSR